MVASGPGTLPPVLTIPALTKLNAGSEAHIPAHVKDRDEIRALWEYLSGTGRLSTEGLQAACDTFTKVKLGSFSTIEMDGTVNVPIGTSWEGDGDLATLIDWVGANGGVMFQYEGPDPPDDPVFAHFSMKNIGFRSATATGVTAIRSYYGGLETFENLSFEGIAKHFDIEGGFSPSIRNIWAAGYGSNSSGGALFKRVTDIDISGYRTYGVSTATAVWRFTHIGAGTVNNFNFYSPNNIGIIIDGDCQGLVFTGGLIVAPSTGVRSIITDGSAPTFCEFIGVKIDQANAYAAEIVDGGQIYFTRCEFTNSRNGIIFGAFNVTLPELPHVIRFGVFLCTFENIGSDGILGVAGCSYFNFLGNHFLGMGASSVGAVPPISPPWANSGCCIRIGPGLTEDYLIAHNDMRNNSGGTIADGATSGAKRCIWDNTGDEPTFTNKVGVSLRSISQSQVESHAVFKKVAVGSPPANPLSGYSNIWVADDNKVYKNTGSDNVPLLDTDLITAAGQLIYGTADETVAALSIGTAHQELAVNSGATAPVWVDGVRKVLTTAGDMPYATAAATLARLGIGANKTMMSSNGSVPSWSASPTLSGSLTAETSLITPLGVFGATASGFGIVQRNKRRDAGSPIVAIGLDVTSAGETDVVKGAIAMKRRGGQGTGDILFLLDNNADTNDVDDTDVKAILLGIPTAGAQVAAHWIFPYFDNSPPANADMPASTICWYVDETGGFLRAKIKKKGGTIVNLTTGLPVA